MPKDKSDAELRWKLDDNFVASLKLDDFMTITCRVCGTTYPLSGDGWISDAKPCPHCDHVEGEYPLE